MQYKYSVKYLYSKYIFVYLFSLIVFILPTIHNLLYHLSTPGSLAGDALVVKYLYNTKIFKVIYTYILRTINIINCTDIISNSWQYLFRTTNLVKQYNNRNLFFFLCIHKTNAVK